MTWTGQTGRICFHPLFEFNQFEHLELCSLRWQCEQRGLMAGRSKAGDCAIRDRHLMRFFRADAAFAIPDLYETLEAEGNFYEIRLRANRILQDWIAHLLKRPVGRPPNRTRRNFGEVECQAAS